MNTTHLAPSDRVAMRAAILEGTPRRNTAVGTVIGHGNTANHGTPYVRVSWPGPEGGIECYHPSRLIKVVRDANGVPRPAPAETSPLEDLAEFSMHDGYVWSAEGPRGRQWSIVWQPDRPTDNIRAWPFPGGRTAHWGQAHDLDTARRVAREIADKIHSGKS